VSLAFESPTVIKRSKLDPRISGFGTLPVLGRGRVAGNEVRGYDCADPVRVFRAGQDDQGDRARAACVAEHGAQGDSLRDDGFRV
jgi:hypothetical protein